ncbi:hypothetical protein ACFQ7O_01005 [Streptomyces sp. NPDC056485]
MGHDRHQAGVESSHGGNPLTDLSTLTGPVPARIRAYLRKDFDS